jgi:hypothetical protein
MEKKMEEDFLFRMIIIDLLEALKIILNMEKELCILIKIKNYLKKYGIMEF